MTQVARVSELSRERLHKALSGEPSPSFNTILKVVTALDLKLPAIVRCEAEVT
jgi:probable addiction module antidote protein